MIGIMAYGSLIDDPGAEIGAATVSIIEGLTTPFCIEFARKSRTRNFAPTLVPVDSSGEGAKCVVRVLRSDITERHAMDMLWRRETRSSQHRAYSAPENPGPNTVLVKRLPGYSGLHVVLYTSIAANIEPLTPVKLAELAIASVRPDSPSTRKDGISYLISVKRAGIVTPLMPEYEKEILRQTGTKTLEQAFNQAAAKSVNS